MDIFTPTARQEQEQALFRWLLVNDPTASTVGIRAVIRHRGLLDCGHVPTATDNPCAPGVAHNGDGKSMCYACSDAVTLAAVAAVESPGTTAPVALYLSGDGKRVTSWPGATVMTNVERGARHPWSSDRFYLSAVDVDGRRWSGTGAEGMYVVLRLTRDHG